MSKAHQQIMNEGDSIKSPWSAGCAIQLLLFNSKSWEALSNYPGLDLSHCFVLKQCNSSLPALALSVSAFHSRGLFPLLYLNVQISVELKQYFTYKCIIFPFLVICSFSAEPSKAVISHECLYVGNRTEIRCS